MCVNPDQCSCYYGFKGRQCEIFEWKDTKACGYRCTFDQGVCRVNATFYTDRYGCWHVCLCARRACAMYLSVGLRVLYFDKCAYFGNISRYWNCKCGHGYFGATCSRFTCPRGCSHNGHCLDKDTCSCFRGFLGASCEIDCGCGGHGQCNSDGKCICDVGWRHDGKKCVWSCDKEESAEGCIGPGQSGCSEECKFGVCVDGRCRSVRMYLFV